MREVDCSFKSESAPSNHLQIRVYSNLLLLRVLSYCTLHCTTGSVDAEEVFLRSTEWPQSSQKISSCVRQLVKKNLDVAIFDSKMGLRYIDSRIQNTGMAKGSEA